MLEFWTFYVMLAIFLCFFAGIVLPFGWALGYACYWSIWVKNMRKLSQLKGEENSDKGKTHTHTDLNDEGAKRKQ